MSVFLLAVRNLLRKPARTVLTMLGVTVAVVAFVLLRTVSTSWEANAFPGALDRSYVRNKIAPNTNMPAHYLDRIRQMPGVRAATPTVYEGGKDPKQPGSFFNTYFVEPTSYMEVFHEMRLTAAEREGWVKNRQGVVLGDRLAQKLGVKVGDRLAVEGLRFGGGWSYVVEGIYTVPSRTMDRNQMLAHLDYLNEGLQPQRRDQVQFIMVRASDAARNADLGAAVDAAFKDQTPQTLTQTELQVQASFAGFFSAVVLAVRTVSYAILLIVLLIVGNALTMGVRERTREYGVLRALGFPARQVALVIFGEGVLLTGAGGALGIALALPFVGGVVGPQIEQAMESFLSSFQITPGTVALAALFAVAAGAIGPTLGARRALRMPLTDALRRAE